MIEPDEWNPAWLCRLHDLCGKVDNEGTNDTLYITFTKQSYSKAEVEEIASALGRAGADECWMERGRLRLWWD